MTKSSVVAACFAGLLCLLPQNATASCLCTVVRPLVPGGAPVSESLADRAATRDAIFEGTVLQLRNPASSLLPPAAPDEPQSVLLLVRQAWKGVEQDTVTLRVGRNAPCASYLIGQTYLVLADRSVDGLRTAECDGSWAVSTDAARSVSSALGEPSWLEPGLGQRSIDTDIVLPGETLDASAGLMYVGLAFNSVTSPVRVEIADKAVNVSSVILVALPAGFYRARLTFSSGDVETWDLLVSCDETLRGRCVAQRHWWK